MDSETRAYLWTILNTIYKTHVLCVYKKRLPENFFLRTQNMCLIEKTLMIIILGGGGYIILSTSLSFELSILRNKISCP